MRKHHARVLGLCLSMLQDESEAQDAAQEAFLKAYRALDRFDARAAFSTWLYRIASNQCLDALRRRARRKEESLDDAAANERAPEFWEAGRPGERLEAADLAARALKTLSPDYRLVLTLREMDGLTYEEIASTLECTVDAVKARLKRARRQLLESLRHLAGSGSV